MNKLLILKGLPASGKTTHAKELVLGGYKRVNKDDLRAMINSSKWSDKKEKEIVESRDLLVIQYLDEGFDVVVDDTNLHPSHEENLRKIAENCDAEVEVKFFDTPVTECIERDAKRGDKSVGAEVIMGMYNTYLKPKAPAYNPALPQCFIFDIDGTLATMNGRSPYDYTRVSEDSVNEPIAIILDSLKKDNEGYKIFIMSGRQANCREETIEWLEVIADIKYDGLFMRATDDKRKDSIVKKELYDEFIKGKYNVVAVFDDRDQVVDLWRSLGLTCLQVNYGKF